MKKPARGRTKRKPTPKRQPGFTRSTPEQRPWRGDAYWETSSFTYAPRYALVRYLWHYQPMTRKLQTITRGVLYWETGEWGEAVHLLDTLPLQLCSRETVQELQNIARDILSWGEAQRGKPTSGTVGRQLQQFESALATMLRVGRGAHSPPLDAVDIEVLRVRGQDWRPLSEFLKESQIYLSATHRAILTYSVKMGRPQIEVTRRWVWRLCDWWVRSTSETPSSLHDRTTGEYSGEFHQFAFSAISPAFGDRGLNAVIERVVKQWRESTSKNR